ncbi:hypothetical protein PV371_38730 [Streptomyces sp. TX20-6-3]|uniref:hypothetical protein n=1 Tax=Streptomyces sp. TX20-6-3 TaxID=3028705 RepID=UPI0029B55BC7|nr:hypothetical protein [Streptomyces sp. TX20-6-3]MDX2565450.1 hypothetical protein [Streptomyces sp. TX20-6-3]
MKAISHLLLGSGRFPDSLCVELRREGLIFLQEGLRGSLTLKGYRSPTRKAKWAKHAITGAIAITQDRLIVWGARSKQVDVPRRLEWLSSIDVRPEGGEVLAVVYDASVFHWDRSGVIEIRLRTKRAKEIADIWDGR